MVEVSVRPIDLDGLGEALTSSFKVHDVVQADPLVVPSKRVEGLQLDALGVVCNRLLETTQLIIDEPSVEDSSRVIRTEFYCLGIVRNGFRVSEGLTELGAQLIPST